MNYFNTEEPYLLFQKAVRNDIFVDKSMLIDAVASKIGTNSGYLCITRPRRFGKSMNAQMLGAYYTKGVESAALFEQLRIAAVKECQRHRNHHNVIFADMSRLPDFCSSYQEYIAAFIEGLREDLQEAFPALGRKKYSSISKMFRDSKASFIFILDEWDSVFYQDFMTDADKYAYLSFLKNLLKDQPYVELAYMTGVLPVAK